MRFAAFPAIVLGIAVLTVGCKENETIETVVRPVRTVVADPKPIEDDRQAVGEIRPRQESDLGFRVGGKVISRTVDIGATVKQGDLLARLDEQDFLNKQRSAEADVASAEAVLVESQATESRQSQLLEKAVTTKSSYDAAVKNRRSAEAKLDSAKAALDLAKDQLKYTELRADFDGIVTATGVEAGQVVNSGQMIVRLARPDEIDAVFNVAEAAFRDRTPGERVAVLVTLLSSPNISAEGVVREVSPVADPATRTYQVKVSLEKPPYAMRFGASVMGRLKAVTAPVVALPGSALYDKSGKPAVWVYNATTSTIGLKTVSVSRFETDRVIISEGLAKGELVVTAGVNRLQEGQKVRLIEGVTP